MGVENLKVELLATRLLRKFQKNKLEILIKEFLILNLSIKTLKLKYNSVNKLEIKFKIEYSIKHRYFKSKKWKKRIF